MLGLSECEMLFYGGVCVMVTAVVLGIVCAVILSYSGRKIKKKMEQEYGKKRTEE